MSRKDLPHGCSVLQLRNRMMICELDVKYICMAVVSVSSMWALSVVGSDEDITVVPPAILFLRANTLSMPSCRAPFGTATAPPPAAVSLDARCTAPHNLTSAQARCGHSSQQLYVGATSIKKVVQGKPGQKRKFKCLHFNIFLLQSTGLKLNRPTSYSGLCSVLKLPLHSSSQEKTRKNSPQHQSSNVLRHQSTSASRQCILESHTTVVGTGRRWSTPSSSSA